MNFNNHYQRTLDQGNIVLKSNLKRYPMTLFSDLNGFDITTYKEYTEFRDNLRDQGTHLEKFRFGEQTFAKMFSWVALHEKFDAQYFIEDELIADPKIYRAQFSLICMEISSRLQKMLHSEDYIMALNKGYFTKLCFESDWYAEAKLIENNPEVFKKGCYFWVVVTVVGCIMFQKIKKVEDLNNQARFFDALAQHQMSGINKGNPKVDLKMQQFVNFFSVVLTGEKLIRGLKRKLLEIQSDEDPEVEEIQNPHKKIQAQQPIVVPQPKFFMFPEFREKYGCEELRLVPLKQQFRVPSTGVVYREQLATKDQLEECAFKFVHQSKDWVRCIKMFEDPSFLSEYKNRQTLLDIMTEYMSDCKEWIKQVIAAGVLSEAFFNERQLFKLILQW